MFDTLCLDGGLRLVDAWLDLGFVSILLVIQLPAGMTSSPMDYEGSGGWAVLTA